MDGKALFEAIDTFNAEKFVTFIAEDGHFRMGSLTELRGRRAIADYVSQFWTSLRDCKHHTIVEYQTKGEENVVIFEGKVTYYLKNGNEATLDFLNRLKVENGLAVEYFIYIDPTPLFKAMQSPEKEISS